MGAFPDGAWAASQQEETPVLSRTTDGLSVGRLWDRTWSARAGESDELSSACRPRAGVQAAV
jgi:hypothetical protein